MYWIYHCQYFYQYKSLSPQGVFSNTSLLSAVYYYNIRALISARVSLEKILPRACWSLSRWGPPIQLAIAPTLLVMKLSYWTIAHGSYLFSTSPLYSPSSCIKNQLSPVQLKAIDIDSTHRPSNQKCRRSLPSHYPVSNIMQSGSDLLDDTNIRGCVFVFSFRSVSNAVTLVARVCHRRAAGNLRKHWCEEQTDRFDTFPHVTPGSGDMQTFGHPISLRSKNLLILWESGHEWWYFWGQNAFRDVGRLVQKYLAMSPKLFAVLIISGGWQLRSCHKVFCRH